MINEKITVLTLNTSVFREQLKHLSPFMSSEEVRYYLNGVFLTYDGVDLNAVATNGHILYEANVPYTDGKGEAFSGICPRGAVETLLEMLKGSHKSLVLTATHGDRLRFTFDDLDKQLSFKALEGKFPDYKRAIPEPKREKQVHNDRFNVDYLLAVSRVFQGAAVNIFSGGENDSVGYPHVFQSEAHPGVRCVVMPMRTLE